MEHDFFLFAQFIFDVFFMYCHYKLKCLPKLVLGELGAWGCSHTWKIQVWCILGECYIIAKLKEIILYKLRLYGAANQSAWFLFKMLFRAHNMHGWSGRVFMCYETL